ncbi:MAG: hypothetical protein ACRC62_03220 [Microcoleus sp.]
MGGNYKPSNKVRVTGFYARRRKKEEGRRQKAEGRRQREEGRKKEEGRGKRE